MYIEAALSIIILFWGAILVLVPFGRNRAFGFRVKAAYRSEEAWGRMNRRFGFYLLLTGLLALFFAHSQYYYIYVLILIIIAFLATYFQEKSDLIAPASLLAVFIITNLFAYPSLSEVIAVHFSGLGADRWGTKGEYMQRAILFYSLFTLFFIWVSRDRRYILPVMHGTLVLVLFINTVILSISSLGADISILLYLSLLVFLLYLGLYYRNLGRKATP